MGTTLTEDSDEELGHCSHLAHHLCTIGQILELSGLQISHL